MSDKQKQMFASPEEDAKIRQLFAARESFAELARLGGCILEPPSPSQPKPERGD